MALNLTADGPQSFFNGALDNEAQFNPDNLFAKSMAVNKSTSPRLRFDNITELNEAINSLPLLRSPREKIDPRETVVACHIEDLPEAQEFYGKLYSKQPDFYVLAASKANARNDIHNFSELKADMDIHLYFRQTKKPLMSHFAPMAAQLRQKGISEFSYEKYCSLKFWRWRPTVLSEADWEIIRDFVNILEDAHSQYTYMAICRSRLEREPGYIPIAAYEQYFHPIVKAEPGDIICEGGCAPEYHNYAFTSTTRDFYMAMRQQGKIFGFEPVAETCARLKKDLSDCEGIEIINKALWSESGNLLLGGSGTSAFTKSSAAKGNCPSISIDEFFSGKSSPNLIKLDVEGAEPEVVKGAKNTLRRQMPKLMIAIYHKLTGADWLNVPRLLLAENLPYQYYCGHHQPWYAESILYAKTA